MPQRGGPQHLESGKPYPQATTFKSMKIYTVLGDHKHKHKHKHCCSPEPGNLEVFHGWSSTKIRAPDERIRSFLGNTSEMEKGRRRAPRLCSQPVL